ncbi:hypothetical protein Mapa_007682 [Marchantia paleacea]|nr:hypothetical protein Mapa_007682 [Marchantia paleacea]
MLNRIHKNYIRVCAVLLDRLCHPVLPRRCGSGLLVLVMRRNAASIGMCLGLFFQFMTVMMIVCESKLFSTALARVNRTPHRPTFVAQTCKKTSEYSTSTRYCYKTNIHDGDPGLGIKNLYCTL